MASNDILSSTLFEKIPQRVKEKLPTAEAAQVIYFAETLFSNLPLEDWYQRSECNLYGALISLWQHLQATTTNALSIRIYNPQIEQHGWQSPHTLVKIMLPDRPFVVDSVRLVFERLQIPIGLMLHGPFPVVRDSQGNVIGFDTQAEQVTYYTICQVEAGRLLTEEEMQQLERELRPVMNEVILAVDDWSPMRERLQAISECFNQQSLPVDPALQQESNEFIQWILAGNFILLGYQRLLLHPVNGDYCLQPEVGSALGIARRSNEKHRICLADFPESARREMGRPSLLILTKSSHRSRIHRAAYLDYIGIKRFNEQGHVIGEERLIGLYTSSTYVQSAQQIPLIRHKVQRILQQSGLRASCHAYKSMINILESLPRDELIQAHEEELTEVAVGVYQMHNRDSTRLFIRRDPYGHFFSCLVFLPGKRYNSQLRMKSQAILQQALNSQQPVEYHVLSAGERLTRVHYIVWVNDNNIEVNVKAIEQNLIEAANTWEDMLHKALLTHFGNLNGKQLAQQFANAFPRAYQDNVLPSAAVADIGQLERLSEQSPLGMLFYRPQELQTDTTLIKLKLFKQHEPLPLSDIMPVLENLGLRVIGETPYAIHMPDGRCFWILDFHMTQQANGLDLTQAQARLQEALEGICFARYENDGLNRLVLAGLTARQVVVLRAYARYLRQTGTLFSQHYIERVLTRHSDVARLLVELFECRFNPEITYDANQQQQLSRQINQALEAVAILDEDRIIRRYQEMILATVRTNYFQQLPDGCHKSWVSFKLHPETLSDMPLPLPRFEIFVYSPTVEGIHLRSGKVARGGLRWSDRLEDFRCEVLGLMKAQQVKNGVIVPVGAKGGFICKSLLQDQEQDRASQIAEAKRCYQTFIRALLDVTDNIVQGQIVAPPQVIRHDEDDPYLVVAADKGTATFSDLANAIAEEYQFWLRDAFASGGSNGYDHKKMGITARGAWEAVKRHFREIGVDCQTTEFTAIGIGDMAGDVFGNGMLQSPHIKLIAAFNHQHIFFDPEPDAQQSYQERQRLFNLPSSSWSDYDNSLISLGGGIFSRSAKSIPLSPQMQQWLNTREAALSPNALIHALLQLPVDLLWNGGIGTYVKATSENHIDVGDRTNDIVRINAKQLHAKVVGEGGNLGLTQRGRIEYALKGGRLNTDFIDNVGGVDCSDNEVNIKILLNALVDSGELTLKQRNQLLEEMTQEIATIVLNDADQQARGISVTENRGSEVLRDMVRLIHALENSGDLNRTLEFLPTDEELNERQLDHQGLTRPELAVLAAYSKMVLKQALVTPAITEDPVHHQELLNNFPRVLRTRFSMAMSQHPLRQEIIATQLANHVVNEMGAEFCLRMQDETSASWVEIVNAYVVARTVFDLDTLLTDIEALNNQVLLEMQYALLVACQRLIRRATRWFLRNRSRHTSPTAMIEFFRPVYHSLSAQLADYLAPEQQLRHQEEAAHYQAAGVPDVLALRITENARLCATMDIAEIAAQQQREVSTVATLYFSLGIELHLDWFLSQIQLQRVENHWQALARASLREELQWHHRCLTAKVLATCSHNEETVASLLMTWIQQNEAQLSRWNKILTEFKLGSAHEFAKFSVAMRELTLLHTNS
ncbi:MAG: NAD-glutamate dehydrogenase [Candidatus Symbiodolus clandestinus]